MRALLTAEPAMAPEQARLLSPLQLAYVGDSVHALLVRTYLMEKNLPVRDMHADANRAVSAVSQAREAQRIAPLLTEEESDVFRRGRNAHPRHAGPKSATAGEYAGATGLEALLGYLYLTGQSGRIQALMPYLLTSDQESSER